ncbi:MAG: hypothetical protein RL625_1653 [Gemmatimonadota bacterium]
MVARTAKKGFTLIELLIVVVIIGILASIAIPKFGNTKTSAQISAMKSDLRNLATSQETRFASLGSYGTNLASVSPTYFQPSANITITLGAPVGQVYTATAGLVAGVTVTCTMTVNSTVQADSSGAPVCL